MKNEKTDVCREVLLVVLREMEAFGNGWRMDWSEFDGRTLRNQLDSLSKWAYQRLQGEDLPEFKRGSEFYNER